MWRCALPVVVVAAMSVVLLAAVFLAIGMAKGCLLVPSPDPGQPSPARSGK